MHSMQQDVNNAINRMTQLEADLQIKKENLDGQKEKLISLKSERKGSKSELEQERLAKNSLLFVTKGQENKYQKELEKSQAELAEAQDQINRLINLQRSGWDGQIINPDFVAPLKGEVRIGVVGGDFMDPAYGFGFPHTGVDLKAEQGTPVYAAGDGVVLIAHDSGGSGLSYIAIDHENGLVTKYLHLSEVWAKDGQRVVKGETVIGLSGGAPGSHGAGYFTTGAHLHFEVRDYNGTALDPKLFIYILPAL